MQLRQDYRPSLEKLARGRSTTVDKVVEGILTWLTAGRGEWTHRTVDEALGFYVRNFTGYNRA